MPNSTTMTRIRHAKKLGWKFEDGSNDVMMIAISPKGVREEIMQTDAAMTVAGVPLLMEMKRQLGIKLADHEQFIHGRRQMQENGKDKSYWNSRRKSKG